jgi:hypothetical protein
MATTKKPTTKAAKPVAKPKTSTSTALSVWEQKMAEVATAQAKNENITGGYKSISFRGGIMSVDDNPVEGNELNVVILAHVHENQRYEGIFDPNNPASPTCYAFGTSDEDMTPHEASPNKQSDKCKGCWANEFGTADIGKGKSCKNVRRLIVITEEEAESAESILDADPRMIKLPVMSVLNWSKYVKNVLDETVHRPSYGVVTTLKVVPDAKSQFKVQFSMERLVEFDDAIYAAMESKVKEAEGSIANAYPVFEVEEKPVKGRRSVNVPVRAAQTKGAPAQAGKKTKY